MIDAIEEIKVRARQLHRRAQAGDPAALERLQRLPELDQEPPAPERIQRKHGLAVIARELGFSGWPHAHRVLEGDEDEADLGTLLYPPSCGAFTNQWFADYATARLTREQAGGYLLGYRRQFFVCSRQFVQTLGLDPDDPDWEAIGFDWIRPQQPAARRRLYAKLIARRSRPSS